VTSLDPRDPRDSSYGRDYWLHRCEGFRVESSDGQLGKVRGLRFQGSIEPELLEVRTGFLGRRRLLIPVERVEEIVPKRKLVILRSAAPLTPPSDQPLAL
jgi:hypothetical protein